MLYHYSAWVAFADFVNRLVDKIYRRLLVGATGRADRATFSGMRDRPSLRNSNSKRFT